MSPPSSPNHTWSIDFMSDKLLNGRSFRSFNVLDDFNREALSIEIDISIPSARVIRALDQLIEQRGKPRALRCDNGPEYTSNKLIQWAKEKQITLLHIHPGKLQQNAYVERLNRTVRHEFFEMNAFISINHAQHEAAKYLWTYNHERPNMAINGISPAMKLAEYNQYCPR